MPQLNAFCASISGSLDLWLTDLCFEVTGTSLHPKSSREMGRTLAHSDSSRFATVLINKKRTFQGFDKNFRKNNKSIRIIRDRTDSSISVGWENEIKKKKKNNLGRMYINRILFWSREKVIMLVHWHLLFLVYTEASIMLQKENRLVPKTKKHQNENSFLTEFLFKLAQ